MRQRPRTRTGSLLAGIVLTGLSPAGTAQAQAAAPTPAAPASPGVPTGAPVLIDRLAPEFDRIVAADARVEALVTIPGVNGEGPIWKDGELWFGDVVSGSVFAVQRDGRYRIVAREAGGPINPALKTRQGAVGMALWMDGAVLVCGGALRDIGILTPDGKRRSFLSAYEGKRLNSPNDLVVARDGALWFSDPAYSVPGYDPRPGSPVPPDKQMPFNGLFRYSKGKLEAKVTDLEVPNGLAFSPDERILYIANSAPEMFVRAYDVGPGGLLKNPRIFARFSEEGRKGPGTPDGIEVDRRGNVWLAGPGGVHVFTPTGKALARIQLAVKPTNLAFGEDGRTLFITAGNTVYRLRTLVTGQIPKYSRPGRR